MSGGDWSTDMTLGNPVPGDLTPASAVRPLGSHASKQDSPVHARRRARQKEEEEDPDDASSDSARGEQPEHRLDHLA